MSSKQIYRYNSPYIDYIKTCQAVIHMDINNIKHIVINTELLKFLSFK